MDKYEVLRKYFGYTSFKEGQEELVDGILTGRDVLGIMPTGAGKSICYQVPALCMEGITIVVSPLISLMMDQVKALNQAGVHAAYINSSLTENQISKALQNARMGQYKIIYVAPERLETERFLYFALNADISMVTIDEAHCISQWGQDFRPSYLKILQFIDRLPVRPIVSAFTATATMVVRKDILEILQLQNPKVLVTGFDRENLFFEVRTGRNKDDQLLHYLQNHLEESGIIYCATRKNVEKVCEFLELRGLPVTKYHAGLSPQERKENQEDFIYDRKPIVVATNAFGMGIDKSNVRYVVHYNMPQSLENYYQEAGRAGRDGMSAECVILYSPQDVHINKYLIENRGENTELTEEQAELVLKNDRERLWAMAGYCKTTHCLREYILRYFGTSRWQDISGKYCGNCSVCLSVSRGYDTSYDTSGFWDEDGYGSSVYDEKTDTVYFGEKYEKPGVGYHGSTGGKKSARQSVYGTGMYGESTVNKRGAGSETYRVEQLTEEQQELFKQLKALRLRIAKAVSLPPYMIFSDKTLLEMSVKHPTNKKEMLQISGVGENKYQRYGEDFEEVILSHLD
ncbi:MAG: RecQ family ATP-dependent DNA helicase [Lachnospiraceae bacterium]|nr:RecQ family ATP-dependent DNA helicase [Lachnospiraceae bacterium]MBP3351255.1 RecQ family ATP-dependent DNA helicase [Lachnospiraceae bacterium]